MDYIFLDVKWAQKPTSNHSPMIWDKDYEKKIGTLVVLDGIGKKMVEE